VFPTTFELNVFLKGTSVVAIYSLQLGNFFFNYKPRKSTTISWKGQPHVNTTTITTTYHFNYKPHNIIINKKFQLFLPNGWTSFANWAWHHPKIQLQFQLGCNYVSCIYMANGLVTHGTFTMLTHGKFAKFGVTKWLNDVACSQNWGSTNNKMKCGTPTSID
jgi:hypothetical protein